MIGFNHMDFAARTCQLPMRGLPTTVNAFVRRAANFAANEINSHATSLQWFTLTNIQNATIEVVMGLMYRMDITLQESACKNLPATNGATPTTCPPKAGASTKLCHVAVLDDPGTTPRFSLKIQRCGA